MCKDEIEDEAQVLFSCKAYEEFRGDVQWFDGLHTAAITDVSNVMSADDKLSIRELSPFFCTELCKEETTLQLHKVAHTTCM